MAFLSPINDISIPQSVQEDLKGKNWTQAMKEEMKTLEKNKTWENS